LPYHLERTPQGFRSGQLAIQPDISHLISMMQQAVLDVRSVVRALMVTSGVDSTKLMLTGTSLGSIVAANVYALEPEINAAAFIVGGVDLAHILWHSSLVVKQRDALRSKGYTEARVRTELADIEPLNFLGQRSASGKTLVIGGRFDTVVPAVDTEKLIQALPSGQHLWLETGHYGGIFVQRRILNEAANFFESLVLGEDYEAPKKLVAPTLRIAATASTMYPLEIGIGIDFISTPRRDMFGTALVTPRGPRLFIGGRLDKSVSIGVIGAPNKVGVGLLWSTIL
jgi:pimeloyl-ACP methyl ester carboxylesterase